MLKNQFLLAFLCFGLFVGNAGTALGQPYPSKPIRVLSGSVGSASDLTVRLIGPDVSKALGQPLVVENRGGTIISAETVAKSPPDGHTILASGSTFLIAPLLEKTPYDPERDFAPVTIVNRSVSILVVHPSLPVKSVKDLIALAKAKPGMLNYSSSGTGSSGHLAGELFKSMAGVNIVRINYKGVDASVNAVMAGEVPITFANVASVDDLIRAGKLRALAVTSVQPSAMAPGLPTVAASGLPGYQSITMAGIFVPVKTPSTIISRLNQEIVRIISRADAKEQLLKAGIEAASSSPEEFASIIKAEMANWRKAIDAAAAGR